MFTWQTKKSMVKAIITKKSPFYVQFYVSKFCHLKCKMCNIVEANADVIPFDSDKIEKIADNLVEIGVGVVLLTGGEPFLRPDIAQIVRVFKEKKLDVRLQTAGLWKRKETITNCFEYGARDINISLDSLDEDLSDYINGKIGSWQDAIRMIAYISRELPGNDSVCALGCVLSAYNLDEIDAILDFATKIGWWLSLVPVHITTNGKPMNFRGYDEDFNFYDKDILKVKELIERLKRKKKQGFLLFDSDHYLDSMFHFISTGEASWRYKQLCDSPNLYFVILPDGRFAPCCDLRFVDDVYIYDEDFPDIYRSKGFRLKVNEITGKCSGCHYGSYPEMSLSARALSTIKERISLQLRAKMGRRRGFVEDELFEMISTIKQRYKYNVYKKQTLKTRDEEK